MMYYPDQLENGAGSRSGLESSAHSMKLCTPPVSMVPCSQVLMHSSFLSSNFHLSTRLHAQASLYRQCQWYFQLHNMARWGKQVGRRDEWKTGIRFTWVFNLNLIDNEILANFHNLSPFEVNFASLHVQCEVCRMQMSKTSLQALPIFKWKRT